MLKIDSPLSYVTSEIRSVDKYLEYYDFRQLDKRAEADRVADNEGVMMRLTATLLLVALAPMVSVALGGSAGETIGCSGRVMSVVAGSYIVHIRNVNRGGQVRIYQGWDQQLNTTGWFNHESHPWQSKVRFVQWFKLAVSCICLSS